MRHSAKSIWIRMCGLLLCVMMVAGMTACAGKTADPDDDFTPIDPLTDTYVVKNGVSPYRIVIPQNPSDQLLLAASELQYFFREATGVELEIVTDTEEMQGKIFSIGETSVQKQSGVTAEYAELGFDGCKVKTAGEAVIMLGVTDDSSSYAVYDYLARQFGLEMYSEDIFKIKHTKDAKLIDVDLTDVPDIPQRIGGVTNLSWYSSAKYMTRFRWHKMEYKWGLRGHSYFAILPPDEYLADHPDWYDDAQDPVEICKTNPDMVAQFVKNLEKIILDNPDAVYFMLGHEDGGPMCPCKNCQAVRDQYEGSNAALEVLFTNQVVQQVNAWAEETVPDRPLQFCMFAYTTTEVPPVKYDQTTQTYYPLNHDEKLMLEHNLGIMIAPISSHVSVPYLDQSYAANVFNGWAALTDNLYVWNYSAPFSNYLSPFDCLGSYEQNYRDYVRMGAQYVFEEGFHGTPIHNFMELREYLASKLMWDTTLDTDSLVRDFMRHFYGAGWEYIYEFYTLWRLHLTELRQFNMYSYTASQLVQDWCQPDLFPKDLLDRYEELFDAALLANEPLQQTDPVMYETYRDNIRSVRCIPRYITLSVYAGYYDYTAYSDMIDEFAEISSIKGVSAWKNSGASIDEVISAWRELLNQK